MANCLLPGLIFLVLYGTSVGAFSLKLSRTDYLSCRRSLSVYLNGWSSPWMTIVASCKNFEWFMNFFRLSCLHCWASALEEIESISICLYFHFLHLFFPVLFVFPSDGLSSSGRWKWSWTPWRTRARALWSPRPPTWGTTKATSGTTRSSQGNYAHYYQRSKILVHVALSQLLTVQKESASA